MEYDNERDRMAHGFDAGSIVDGTVTRDGDRIVIVDDEGVAFDPASALASLEGRKVRMTLVSFEAMQDLGEMLKKAEAASRGDAAAPDDMDARTFERIRFAAEEVIGYPVSSVEAAAGDFVASVKLNVSGTVRRIFVRPDVMLAKGPVEAVCTGLREAGLPETSPERLPS